MRLDISISTVKDIGHLSLVIREVIFINFKLILLLKLLIINYRVSRIYK